MRRVAFWGWDKVNIQNLWELSVSCILCGMNSGIYGQKEDEEEGITENKEEKKIEEEFRNGVYGLIDCACEL